MITINEAIKELDTMWKAGWSRFNIYELNALHLGVEALKLEKRRRGYAQTFNYELLPGETEER